MADAWSARLDQKDANAFDAIRLVLATLVVFEHSFFLVSNSYAGEPLYRLTHGQYNSGSFAVAMFFSISGFLVARSFVLTATPDRYLVKRVARIVPGFIVATAVAALLLAPFVAANVHTYFASQRWPMLALQAITLHQISVGGILAGNPVGLIHGTLWTIIYEFDCYLIVAGLGMLGLLTTRHAWWALGLLIVPLLLSQAGLFPFPKVDTGILALLISSPVRWPSLFPFFFVGGLIYNYRGVVPKHWGLVAVSILALAVTSQVGGLYWALLIGGSYAILFLALSAAVNIDILGRRVDLSYGTYLYGWPIGQLVFYASHQTLKPIPLFLISLPLTLLVAFASWVLVEQPALRFAHRWRSGQGAPA